MLKKTSLPIFLIFNILIFIYPIICYSQGQVWYKVFGSWNEIEQCRRIVQTFDNGYLALTVQGSSSPAYYNILKLDNSGNLLWRKLLKDSSEKYIYEFQQTSDSGFIFAGWCEYSPWGGLLIKTDKNGNFKWQRNYTNLSYQSRFGSVKQTKDKGFICCGSFIDLINGGEKGIAIKTDSLGNIQWEKQYMDSLINTYADIIQDSTNYYLTGDIYNSSNKVYTVLKKLYFNGNIIWTKIFGYNSWGTFLFPMQNNSLRVVGTTVINPNNIPIITKFDSSGNIIWSNNFPSQVYDLYACKDNFDNIIYAGNIDSFNISTIRINKTDSSGNILKSKLVQFAGWKFINSICIKSTLDSGFIISGSASLLDTFNNPHSWSLILKIDSAFNMPLITNIQNNLISFADNFKLYQNYPNPFNSKTVLKFNLTNNGYINFNIFDVLGKKVFSKKKYFLFGTNEQILDFGQYNLSSGVYFIQINFESNSKLIKAIYLK